MNLYMNLWIYAHMNLLVLARSTMFADFSKTNALSLSHRPGVDEFFVKYSLLILRLIPSDPIKSGRHESTSLDHNISMGCQPGNRPYLHDDHGLVGPSQLHTIPGVPVGVPILTIRGIVVRQYFITKTNEKFLLKTEHKKNPRVPKHELLDSTQCHIAKFTGI